MSKEKERKLELKTILSALDRKQIGFYDSLTDEQKKEIEPYVLMTFMSSCSNIKLAYSHLLMVNEVVNVEYEEIRKHPKMQWMLLCLCGSGANQFHPWIARPKKQKNNNKIYNFLSQIYPTLKKDEIELLEEVNSKEELMELAKQQGYSDAELKETFK
jgi:hypothetical protein